MHIILLAAHVHAICSSHVSFITEHRCAINATADGLKMATEAMDGFLSSVVWTAFHLTLRYNYNIPYSIELLQSYVVYHENFCLDTYVLTMQSKYIHISSFILHTSAWQYCSILEALQYFI